MWSAKFHKFQSICLFNKYHGKKCIWNPKHFIVLCGCIKNSIYIHVYICVCTYNKMPGIKTTGGVEDSVQFRYLGSISQPIVEVSFQIFKLKIKIKIQNNE